MTDQTQNAVIVEADSAPGKAFAKILGDTARIVVDADTARAKIAALQAAMESQGINLPIAIAGNVNPESLDGNQIVGFVGKQIQKADEKRSTHYVAIAVAPLHSIESFLAFDDGKEWLEKLVEKETAHVAWRPLRNVDEGESYEAASVVMPVTAESYTQSNRGGTAIDTSALAAIWPMLREQLIAQAPGIAGFLPTAKGAGIATVSKALRSADWAQRNTPEMESRGLWADFIGPMLVQFADAWDKSDDPETQALYLSAQVIPGWLESRDEVVIEAVAPRAAKDESALDDLLSTLGQA